MLVLSRKEDETIRIGNGIVIHICRINGNTVRVGIEAPKDVPVLRGELPEWHFELGQPLKPVVGSLTPR